MKKLYCQHCGKLLENGCDCEREIEIAKQELIEELEERQHNNGFYAFQDIMEMYRRER